MPDPIACTIDLVAPGKRLGRLELVWSDNIHAYGVIPVPIGVIAGGPGPTALVTAGVHGDEYEGLVIARRLLRDLDPEQVKGRIIVMPAVNLPAVRAAARVSPIDGGNMNRAFPGGTGGPTALIADFIERRLLPEVDVAVDLHSGGTQSIYSPCAMSTPSRRGFPPRQVGRGQRLRRAADHNRCRHLVRRLALGRLRAASRRHGGDGARRRGGARPASPPDRRGGDARRAAPRRYPPGRRPQAAARGSVTSRAAPTPSSAPSTACWNSAASRATRSPPAMWQASSGRWTTRPGHRSRCGMRSAAWCWRGARGRCCSRRRHLPQRTAHR